MKEGLIQKGSLPQIVSDVVVNRKTGDIQCTRQHEDKRLFFRDGELVFASTNVDAERIGQVMLEAGLVDPTMLEAVLSIVAPGKRTGRILVVEGVLTPERLIRTVEDFIRRVTCSIFAWKDGRARFTEGERPEIEDVIIKLDAAEILLDACRRIPVTSIAAQAIGNLQEPLRLAMDPALRFQKLSFSSDEAVVMGCVNNFTTAEEVCEASPLDRDSTLKLVCGLIAGGIVESPGPAQPVQESVPSVAAAAAPTRQEYELPDDIFGDPLVPEEVAPPPPKRPAIPPRRPLVTARPAAVPPRPAAPALPPRPQPPARTPMPVEDVFEEEAEPREQQAAPAPEPPRQVSSEQEAAEKAQIMEVHRRLALMDYYTLLEVDRRSDDAEIRTAYFALAKKYHPDRCAAPHLGDCKTAMEEVYGQVNKAYEVLRDPERRRQYDARGAKSEEDLREGVSKDSDEQIADKHFRMAKTLYDQKNYADAIQLLKVATRLNPNKGNYLFLLANALVKANNRREAEETYLKAIEKDRFNSDIYVSLGLLYRASNMGKRAEAMFQKALELNDNHPIALRELAALRPPGQGLLKSFLKKASDKVKR